MSDPIRTTLMLTLTLATAAALSGYALTQNRNWTKRGIDTHAGMLPTVLLGSAAGIAAAHGTYPTWGVAAAISASTAAWLATLAISTDVKSAKVPWDVAYPASVVGLVAFVADYSIEGLLALVASFVGLVLAPLAVRAVTRAGLGMSDIRLLWAVTATCSWWIGQTWLLYGLIGACLIQLAVRLVARPLNLGRVVPVPTKKPRTHADAHGDNQPDHMEEAGASVEREVIVQRTRREIPFAPAIMIGLALGIAYGTHTAYGACQTWNIIASCT